MSEELRVAIAGTGMIGTIHARAARLAGATLVGVAASTPRRSREAAAALGTERAFETAEEIVAADDVDVVHVCTPNHLHAGLAEQALAAGKHVVCEKPLAITPDDARRLAALAETSGLVATVPFVYRFYPTVREARQRVNAGDLGDVRLVHGSYLQDWLSQADDYNWRVDRSQGGRSRAFADIGSHWCDLAEFVTGHRIATLQAQLYTAISERSFSEHAHAFASTEGAGERRPVDTEDAALVTFRTDRGALGSVVVSQISPGRKNRLWLEVDGADAAVQFDQEQPETLWRGTRDGTHIIVRDPAQLSAAAARYSPLPGGHPQGYNDCFELFVADTYAAIRGQRPMDGLPTFVDGARGVAITDAVLASAANQTWKEVAT